MPDYYQKPTIPQLNYDEQEEFLGQRDPTAQVINTLIKEDANVEEKLKESGLWFILSNSLVLTFIDERQAEMLRTDFENAKIIFRSKFSDDEYSKKGIDLFLQNLQMIFEIKLLRSVGMPEGKINERYLISSQIQHQTRVLADDRARQGILGKLGSMFHR